LLTPHADACLPGITRALVIRLAKANGVDLVERNISRTEAHTADEMFTTGSMGELSPVIEVDGRTIGNGDVGPMTVKMQKLHAEAVRSEGIPVPGLVP